MGFLPDKKRLRDALNRLLRSVPDADPRLLAVSGRILETGKVTRVRDDQDLS
jgi:ubiquinone biosynthesis protein UbiJ